jgi:hypothetical protein
VTSEAGHAKSENGDVTVRGYVLSAECPRDKAATWYLVHRERDTYTTRSEVISPTNGPTELSGAEALAIFRKLAAGNPLTDDSDDG